MKKALLVSLVLFAGCMDRDWSGKGIEAVEKYREANALLEAGAPEEAIPLYEEALQERPRMVEAYVHLHECHLRLNAPDEALRSLERGYRICGLNHIVAIPLARAYAARGRKADALELYDRLITFRPELRPEMEKVEGGK